MRRRCRKCKTSPDVLTIHYPYSSIDIKERPECDHYQVASFDPAMLNLAVRIESRNRWEVVPILHEKISLFKPSKCTEDLDHVSDWSSNLFDYLDSISEHLMNCHFVIVEEQMKKNHDTTRIAQFIITYAMTKLKDSPYRPLIVELSPKIKGRQLGSPPDLGHDGMKAWGIFKAHELAIIRDDKMALKYFRNSSSRRGSRKVDDIADAMIQIEGFFLMNSLPVPSVPPWEELDETQQTELRSLYGDNSKMEYHRFYSF